MAFDKPTRNRLASFVAEARRLIADEFTQQFQSLYGISDKGTITPLDQLTHLDDTGLAIAAVMRDRIDYLVKTNPDDRGGNEVAVVRLAREQAFTILNRLAAIRMAERRGIIVESVGKGYQSKGFKVFEQVAGSGLGDIYQRYRRYLFCLFDELAVDLGVLFDRRSPQGLLFPRETALQALCTLLNDAELDPLWAEDETVGWIYQYYNDPAERKKMRDESAAPRNSRELAVRNQFFTPRYVVEFLTDNTLGRIWYEMTRGETSLAEQCRYLVRRPTEIFLEAGEVAPVISQQKGLSQEELFKKPIHIPHRALKDPRELRMLDPACGSMHFGLYAFDLYEVIYEEAWDRGVENLRRDFPDREAFLHEVPRLIIEHNIHGIDIDPRAVQIAGFSLWLRAQKSWQAQRVSAIHRPPILRSNIVCAESMPGDKQMLREFVATQFDAAEQPAFAFLLERVFDRMVLAGEAGSLLKIEEEISGAVNEAKHLWQKGPQYKQGNLFGDLLPKKPEQIQLDFSGISDERFWETAEEQIYAALQVYAEQAESGGYQRRLFADDAARGFAFVDLCRRRYDATLMNPPFGEAAPVSDAYLRANYPLGYIDLYTAFIDRASGIRTEGGFVGAITSRTALTLSSFAKWRRTRLLGATRVGVCADFGYGVLDSAMVEVAAYTLVENVRKAESIFIDLEPFLDKGSELLNALRGESDRLFVVSASDLLSLPNATMAYFLDPSLRTDFADLPSISSFAEVLGGNATSDDERFIRCFWEIPPVSLMPGSNRVWRWISKGGEYSLFYLSIHLVVDWRGDGGYLGEYMYTDRPRNGYLWGPKSWSAVYMGIPGVVWSLRSQKGVSFRALPADCAMSGKSAIVTTRDIQSDLALLSILNTERIAQLARCLATFGSYEKGAIASLPVERENSAILAKYANSGFRAAVQANSYTESDPHFFTIFRHQAGKLRELLDTVRTEIKAQASVVLDSLSAANREYRTGASSVQEWRTKCVSELADAVSSSDVVSEVMGTVFGRWDIRYATGELPASELPDPFAPLPVCPPGMLQGNDGLPLSHQKGRRLRAENHYPLDVAWGGILVDDPEHPLDVERHVRAALAVIWTDRTEDIEHEACELLGVKSLRDWFRKPSGFFAAHLKRYSKSRRQAPIYWPLSTAKGSYTLWLYYHRLTDQILHTALADFVEPKLKAVGAEISILRESAANQNRLEVLLDLENELADFHTEIERITKLPWKPNLNDGVIITACPLAKLFRLPKWQKDLKVCWEKLAKGDYDWAHLAYSMWPKRVEEACKKDRSIAITHNLEHLCHVEPPKAKGKRGKKKSVAGEE